MTAENVGSDRGSVSVSWCFNEAAADDRGKPWYELKTLPSQGRLQ